ncbi:MAG: T9SS type A sorting domain-containing protein [Sphingobacteriia bacterium]|nr:T9SS type A sorting domain-containing protein [Sphingobacteriia bacterium]
MFREIISIIITIILPIFSLNLNAQVNFDEAMALAKNVFLQKSVLASDNEVAEISGFFIKKVQGKTLYLVFNFKKGGFVITAGDKRFYPLLAWSPEGNFCPEKIPDNCADWMHWYEQQILAGLETPEILTRNYEEIWQNFLQDTSGGKERTTQQPLLTAKWDQGKYYNTLCPEDPDGSGGHVPVGCVATAMVQLMYYYRFPQQGSGSHSYVPPYNNGYYGVLTADFGSTFYKWEEMTDQAFTFNQSVAELSYHAAVAVNMKFSPGSSGANPGDIIPALTNYFNYLPTGELLLRQDAGEYEVWRQLLTSHFDNRQPVIYFSSNGFLGHAYICDGYSDSTHFHFNWGWSGNHNGYYYINELIPGGIDLTQSQGAIFHLYPDTNLFAYPEFCRNGNLFISSNGSLTDGSGPQNYQSGSCCRWLIQPDDQSMTNIRLDFSMFELVPEQDCLSVFNGQNSSATLLGNFSGNNLPPVIISSQPALFLKLETCGTTTSNGFHANYHSFRLPFCETLKLVTDAEGLLNDGSDFFNYSNNMDCSWLFTPQIPVYDSVEKTRIEFTFFQLTEGDTLFLYDGEDNTFPLLASLTGNILPPPFVSTGQHLFMNFRTNETDSAGGWEIRHTGLPPAYCSDTTLISAFSGSIEDGSGNKHYNSNSFCHWKLQIPEAEFVTVEFTKVDLELNYDYVLFRDLNKPYTAPVRITGNNIPPPFTINSNNILITFFSDDRDNRFGWELLYHASAESIDSRFLHHFAIYPNPVTDVLMIHRFSDEMESFICTIFDLRGSVLVSNQQTNPEFMLDMRNFQRGVYLLEIKAKYKILQHKIVKL